MNPIVEATLNGHPTEREWMRVCVPLMGQEMGETEGMEWCITKFAEHQAEFPDAYPEVADDSHYEAIFKEKGWI